MARAALVMPAALLLLAIDVRVAGAAEIHQAAQEGNRARVEEILTADPSQIDAVDDGGGTPLHSAALGGNEEVVSCLLSRGARTEAVDDYGNTPLLFAAYGGNLGALKLLCEHGAQVNSVSITGQVALHFAARGGSREMVQVLVEKGANVNTPDVYGRQPLFFAMAAHNEETAAYLREHGGKDDFKLGKTVREELAPGLALITVPFANRTNVVALSGEDGLLLVDTGMAGAVTPLTHELQVMDRGRVRTIVNTHLHADHNGANAGVDSTATVIAFDKLDDLAGKGTLRLSAEGMAGRSGKSLPPHYTYAFAGHDVRIVPVPGMHSAEDVLVVFPEANVVCMGSLLISEGFPGVGSDSIDRYIEFLDTVLDVFPPETRFVAGHGRALDTAGLHDYRKMVAETVGAVRGGMAEGRSLEAIVAAKPLAAWSRYGECSFLPYITAPLWIKTIWRSGEGGAK